MKQNTIQTAGQIVLIPSELISSNPFKNRRYYNVDCLEELALSIKMNGIINPLTVRAAEEGYQIVSGERRFRAALIAGLEILPCILIDVSEEENAVISVLENVQRSAFNYFEEAAAFERLRAQFNLTLSDMAERTGKTESYIINKLRLLSIPASMRAKILEYGLTEKHVAVLLRMKSDKDKELLLERIIDDRLTINETQRAAAEFYRRKKPAGKQLKCFKDITVFANTIDHAVETMLSSGIKALSSREETENYIEYIVRISKTDNRA